MFAGQQLFAPLRPLLDALGCSEPARLESLNAACERSAAVPLSAGGVPIRFVADRDDGFAYEERILLRGEVLTRLGNWHDYFNALVWLTLPRTKSALNLRHCRSLLSQRAAGRVERGPARDAATQFDECGAVFVASDASLLDALRNHRWKELFSSRRADFVRRASVLVFGHALYDQLRRPFRGLCAKAVLVYKDRTWLEQSPARQCQELDAELGRLWAREDAFASPRELQPLPLLGIPGVVPESEDPAYYDDTQQFRPPRRWAT